METYHVKMSRSELNEYLHRIVRLGEVDKVLQRYDREELSQLAEKMSADLERWRDRENMYPEDWEAFLAAINSGPAVEDAKADTVYEEGEWELRLSYRAVGTRSEHRYGMLRYKGEIIQGRELGEERDTALGRVRYYGESPHEMSPWERTGWYLC